MSSMVMCRKTRASSNLPPQLDRQQRKSQDTDKKTRTWISRYEELPPWYQDNPHIQHGYRPESNSTWACIRSWLYLHNETVNIFTHLIPAVGIILAQVWLQEQIALHFPDATFQDRLIFSLNVFAALVTFTLSCAYHTFMNHSQYVSELCLRVDYTGILSLILGSFVSGIYVGFYCEPILQRVYWIMIVLFSAIAGTLVLHPRLQGMQWRTFRTIAFVLTGLSGSAPIGHGLWLYGWQSMWERSGMPYWFFEGAAYGIGAMFFTTRTPERFMPNKFDLWGSSHQIFHVCVVVGAAVHLWGVWQAWSWNYQHAGKCVVP